ncbi:spherulin-1B precursor [Aspergillus luchuensis]|uniref:beta-glucosidase n=1 Tax=Aspergillus kawachii TaxID=1069201 RepID=A0A146FFZ4_ASPKA|nr:spherulin-1B precursor [Aspergillus luchuensis]
MPGTGLHLVVHINAIRVQFQCDKIFYTDLNVPSIEALSVYPSGKKSVSRPVNLWDVIANVTVSVTNTGDRARAEIPQLYLSYPESAKQPVRQLQGFERVELARRERSTVTFPIRRQDVSFWDVEAEQWAVKEVLLETDTRRLKASSVDMLRYFCNVHQIQLQGIGIVGLRKKCLLRDSSDYCEH